MAACTDLWGEVSTRSGSTPGSLDTPRQRSHCEAPQYLPYDENECRLTMAREARKRSEEEALALRNRIAHLKNEEAKALRNVELTYQKVEEVWHRRHKHAAEQLERDARKQQQERAQAEAQAKRNAEREAARRARLIAQQKLLIAKHETAAAGRDERQMRAVQRFEEVSGTQAQAAEQAQRLKMERERAKRSQSSSRAGSASGSRMPAIRRRASSRPASGVC
mmetsp:Transcript_54239/g.123385  ORF Transcript_54239/g.123385 Transcript_54239/m.123385 type:complete len:222 (-) Transcript_54239:102-767(-)